MVKKLLLTIIFLTNVVVLLAQQSYYNDVDLTKTGIELKDELAVKISSTHTNILDYTPGVWEACKATDVNPDNPNEVLLIYGFSASGTTARTRGIDDNGGSNGDWNREHTFARSLGNPSFDRGDTPYSDAHHLRPSDVQYNATRGNKLFGEGSGNSGEQASGDWYPGDEWKGDIARMMMYMYLRYGSQCVPSDIGVGTNAGAGDDMIDLFLQWNAEDPVSAIEDKRNEFHEDTSNTYAQGNRNPFIDNPNLATQIWGGPAAQDRWGTASTDDFNSFGNLRVFPNPSNTGNVTIKSSNEITEVKVISIIGKEIYFKKNPEFVAQKFTIENLNSGIYLVRLSNANSSVTKKLLVK
ncbi:endonuclease [Tenacibaculum sp. M341]|uniref:endonuclease n=1 Tax=Tenacibaculum sp. M341 TaxID=2530339 RepID=UPI0014056082|nr:endonuclease [Tenacibaculum sp. M341]